MRPLCATRMYVDPCFWRFLVPAPHPPGMPFRHTRWLNSPDRTAASRLSVRIHFQRPQIMFGVLEIVLRRDPVSGQCFGASQSQVALIGFLCALRVPCLSVREPGRFCSRQRRLSRHCLGHPRRGCARLRRRSFEFRNVLHVGPYVAAAASPATFMLRWSNAARSTGELLQWQRSNFDGCAGGRGRHSIKNNRGRRTIPARPSLHRQAKGRFQVAGRRHRLR